MRIKKFIDLSPTTLGLLVFWGLVLYLVYKANPEQSKSIFDAAVQVLHSLSTRILTPFFSTARY
jgi:hypothetical protein